MHGAVTEPLTPALVEQATGVGSVAVVGRFGFASWEEVACKKSPPVAGVSRRGAIRIRTYVLALFWRK